MYVRISVTLAFYIIGGATREQQIIQKEQILAELQRVEKELKEKGPAATGIPTGVVAASMSSNILEQQPSDGISGQKGAMATGNTAVSLNIPAATEILQNMANLTLQDQHHRGKLLGLQTRQVAIYFYIFYTWPII